MNKRQSQFDRFIQGVGKEFAAQMRYQFQREQFMNELTKREERQKLVQEIAAEVLSHISATVDATEIFDSINEIKKALDDLYRKYGM